MSFLGFSLPADPTFEARAPLERIEVEADREGTPCPELYRPYVLIDAIHDGNAIPAEFLTNAPRNHWEELMAIYARQRSWGATLIAGHLASALRLPMFLRVNTARALVDFGRFPGVVHRSARRRQDLAIRPPFDEWLTATQQHDLLCQHYDVISRGFDAALESMRVKVALHTHDERDELGRLQPPISLMTRCRSSADGTDHHGPFDPLFPMELLESTADRALKSRVALELEAEGLRVSENHPGLLDDGSVEARSLARRFFRRVQIAFEQTARPCRRIGDASPRDLVWEMLLDTNQRSCISDVMRGHLHRTRRPPEGYEKVFGAARFDYEEISAFVLEHQESLVESFTLSSERVSVLYVQVRKDLVWNSVGGPFGTPRRDAARAIARAIARGVSHYLLEDRPEVVEDAVSGEMDAPVTNQTFGRKLLRTAGE
ncbi:MAG: hypothetical protein HC923_13020 [Myxococcales bacterium]|nr:hypothetical protein [Myxococcales bacterium]